MKVVRIMEIDDPKGGLVLKSLKEIVDVLGDVEDFEAGEELILRFEEMREKDFDNLGEWGGF